MLKTMLKEQGLSASRDPLTGFLNMVFSGIIQKAVKTLVKQRFPTLHPDIPRLRSYPCRGSRLPALPRSAGRPRLAEAPRNPPKGKETIGKTMFWWKSFRKTMLKNLAKNLAKKPS